MSQQSICFSTQQPTLLSEREYSHITVYFDPSKGNTKSIGTPPTVWTTAEVSVGLLAACIPPLNPLIRRISSRRKMCDSTDNALASRRSGRGKPSERLSSVEDIPKILDLDEWKIKAATGVETEMTDYGRSKA